jgi:hypothetical protein
MKLWGPPLRFLARTHALSGLVARDHVVGPSDRYRNPDIPSNLPEKDACRPVCRPPLQLLSNAISRREAIPVAFTGTSAGSLKASSGCAVCQVTREEWAWPPETRRVSLYPVQPSLVDTCIRVDTYLSLGHA